MKLFKFLPLCLLFLGYAFQMIVGAFSLADGQKLLEQHLASKYVSILTQVVLLEDLKAVKLEVIGTQPGIFGNRKANTGYFCKPLFQEKIFSGKTVVAYSLLLANISRIIRAPHSATIHHDDRIAERTVDIHIKVSCEP